MAENKETALPAESPACTMPVPSTTPSRPLPFGLDELLDRGKDDIDDKRAVMYTIFGEALREDSVYGSDKDAVCDKAAAAIADLFPAAGYIDNVDRDDKDALQEAENETWYFVDRLWSALIATCLRVPHHLEHPGHATLLGILQSLMEKQKGRGRVQHDCHEMNLWDSLPQFKYTMNYKWSGPSGRGLEREEQKQVDGEEGLDVDKIIKKWRNGSAFLARGHCADGTLCWEFTDKNGMPYLCRGLEGGTPDSNSSDARNRSLFADESSHNGLFDDGTAPLALWVDGTVLTASQRSDIMAATSWITYSGDYLYRRSKTNDRWRKKYKDRSKLCEYPAGRLFLERYPEANAGLSVARWTFWKERLKSLLNPAPLRSRDMAVDEDLLDAVALAVKKMEQIEEDRRPVDDMMDKYDDEELKQSETALAHLDVEYEEQNGAEENENDQRDTHVDTE